MSTYLLVGLGGFLGANARYLVARLVAATLGVHFPYGTLVINVVGSFLLCFLAAAVSERIVWFPAIRLSVLVGFLGAFTTFSTFSYEWLELLHDGELGLCLLYVGGSLIGGGVAGGVGLLLGRLLS